MIIGRGRWSTPDQGQVPSDARHPGADRRPAHPTGHLTGRHPPDPRSSRPPHGKLPLAKGPGPIAGIEHRDRNADGPGLIPAHLGEHLARCHDARSEFRNCLNRNDFPPMSSRSSDFYPIVRPGPACLPADRRSQAGCCWLCPAAFLENSPPNDRNGQILAMNGDGFTAHEGDFRAKRPHFSG